ncbi:FIST C-terminal domain-containing protein [Rhodobacter sp. NTK016B]|uniref:FIST N-terminal domain-containing protein n=1 Tax=Rhodobacter sp. NTK016B TaxID=2759676 RepID=UPI001A8F0371|nr:FIST N-terminal domain-containing protein [Rhodobacter sp. NTK016B]MBN8291479.1 FIST C-terminal domain-containing protein [Rhodobacter sp. NTK016B]
MNQSVIRIAECPADDPACVATLKAGLGPGPFALVVVFVSPEAGEPGSLLSGLSQASHPAPVIGCTTAGEIGAIGYAEGLVVAVGFPAAEFGAETLLVPDLSRLDAQTVIGDLIRARGTLTQAHPGWDNEFVFLMIDGLSTKEDEFASMIAPGLGGAQLFGGSAADGSRFLETFIFHDGQALRNAAVLALVRSRCEIRVFRFDHFQPTDTRMVVTGADPARRTVQTINAEPAAQEYARLLGKDPQQLSPFIFAAHPVVVRIGGRHHVRSIRQVDDNGDLIFYSAIDEGLVLTLAEAQDMSDHLDTALRSLSRNGTPPDAILACDCVLRRMEAQEKQLTTQISSLLRAHRVTGFSTYGEQLNAMHVNQTLTGVAIYPPVVSP